MKRPQSETRCSVWRCRLLGAALPSGRGSVSSSFRPGRLRSRPTRGGGGRQTWRCSWTAASVGTTGAGGAEWAAVLLRVGCLRLRFGTCQRRVEIAPPWLAARCCCSRLLLQPELSSGPEPLSSRGPAPIRFKPERWRPLRRGRRRGGGGGGVGPQSGLYHLNSADRDHETGDLGLLRVHGKMAENVVCCWMSRVTLTGGKTQSRWKRGGLGEPRPSGCCCSTFLLQGEQTHCFYICTLALTLLLRRRMQRKSNDL